MYNVHNVLLLPKNQDGTSNIKSGQSSLVSFIVEILVEDGLKTFIFLYNTFTYNIQYTIYNIQYTIYNIQYTIYNIQYTMHNINYTKQNI